ncbi:MAG: 7-cyano-7-deazaguanine synthase QueC [Planctomycetaceae bacterium]|jgi:7-cyano-7-deazaguanine synthase|nr:7-cyano-7-deazaguanine synthase QueC [Planctomycetaceae bacterium]
MKRAVVLLSGGLDSTTVAAVAKSEGNDLFALTIDYNQRHRAELEAARRIANWLGVSRHFVMPIDLRLFGGSSLTDNLPVPKDTVSEKIGHQIPNTYVPARNTIFLSLALALAETSNASKIYIGISQVDYSGYPDCRPEFLSAFSALANLATKTGVEKKHSPISIEAPLMMLGKTETIRLGLSLGVDYSLTHTCYDPSSTGLACGHCESCLLRLNAFAELGIPDPIQYIRR